MKLTKLLAMLLALCMILCCFAACNSSDDDDDDDDEKVEEKDDDEDDEDEDDEKSDKDDDDEDEEDTKKSEDDDDEDDEDDEDEYHREDVAVDTDENEEFISGEWILSVSMADVIYINSGVEVDEDIVFTSKYIFEDGEYEAEPFGGFEDEALDDFVDAYFDAFMDWTLEYFGVDNKADFETLVISSGEYNSLSEYEDEIYQYCKDDVYNVNESFEEYYEGEYTFDLGSGELILDGELAFELEIKDEYSMVVDGCNIEAYVGSIFYKH